MQSPFSFVKVMSFLLINILVSALTTWIVVRTLIPPLGQTSTVPATAIAATDASGTPSSASATSAANNNAPPEPTAITPINTPEPAQALPTPTLLNAEPKSDLAGTENVRISSVIYAGQLSREVVVLLNEGDLVDMTGWQLVPPRGTSYTFGPVKIFKNSFLNLHTTTGADVPNDLFWGLGEPMWQSGDEVKLMRQDGSVAATFVVK
jgi:hypothetical protein